MSSSPAGGRSRSARPSDAPAARETARPRLPAPRACAPGASIYGQRWRNSSATRPFSRRWRTPLWGVAAGRLTPAFAGGRSVRTRTSQGPRYEVEVNNGHPGFWASGRDRRRAQGAGHRTAPGDCATIFPRAISSQATFGKGPHDSGFTCDIVDARHPGRSSSRRRTRAWRRMARSTARADRDKQLRRYTRRLEGSPERRGQCAFAENWRL